MENRSAHKFSESQEDRTLIDTLLEEQRALTAVTRFAQRHENHEIPQQAKYYRDLIPFSLPKKGQQYAFEVDLDKCSGCKACVTACHNLNGLDKNETWRSVGSLHGGTTLQPLQVNVTTACHHCVDPACLNGCPTLAYEKDSVTGIVHHLDDQCIGCQYCVLKCPYEVPQYHKKKGIVRKCDMCSSRLLVNEAPACVQACPNEAIRITLVGQKQIAIETTSSAQLVPGAPASDYTIPTTRYLSAREFPANTQPADFAQLKPAPSHPPLVFMLVLTQLSAGLFCVDWLNGLFFPSATPEFQKINLSVALLFGFLGLAASVLHLGRPLQAWRAFLGWRKSWLSREVICFGLFINLAAYQVAPFWLRMTAPGNLLQAAVAITGLLGIFCSVMVYADTPRVCWKFQTSATKFFGSTILLGLVASVALSIVLKNGVPNFFIAALILISAAKLGWEANGLRTRKFHPFFNPTWPFSLAPCFSRVWKRHEKENRFNGLSHAVKTVETVPTSANCTTTQLKQGANETAFNVRSSVRETFELKQSALLQRTVLRRATVTRFVCGALGGIVLPGALMFSAQLNPAFLSVVALTSFALCLLGELLERNLFFTAVVAPKMPGGVSP